jgi:hypothetical protein
MPAAQPLIGGMNGLAVFGSAASGALQGDTMPSTFFFFRTSCIFFGIDPIAIAGGAIMQVTCKRIEEHDHDDEPPPNPVR